MGGNRNKNNEFDIKLTKSELSTLSVRGYTILKKLNQGSYAWVYLAEYKNSQKNGKVSSLACKVIDTDFVPKDFAKKFLPREIDFLTKLSHPHLVHTHSIFQRRSKYFIFLRHMENGDLLDFILSRGAVHEDQARIWTRQIAMAVQYMHEMDIAHRDIKCENVLLTANYNAKLTDFGFMRNCLDDDGHYFRSDTFCGSLSYTAPEILQGSPYYPKPTDVWSLGVVLYVMLNRAMPFEDKHVKSLLQSQLTNNWRFRSKYYYKISDQCKTLIKAMLNPNYQNRIKIQDIIEGTWIAMDTRLTDWTPQELLALQKARKEKQIRAKKNVSNKTLANRPASSDARGTLRGAHATVADPTSVGVASAVGVPSSGGGQSTPGAPASAPAQASPPAGPSSPANTPATSTLKHTEFITNNENIEVGDSSNEEP